MKPLNLFLLAFCCSLSSVLFAQTPKQIEVDLLNAFKKIECWDGQKGKDTTMAAFDSLETANEIFGKKLQRYTSRYPFTINYKYSRFANSGLAINTSSDGNFVIYSWDTQTGGSMHYFANVLQWKSGQKTASILDTASGENQRYVIATVVFSL